MGVDRRRSVGSPTRPSQQPKPALTSPSTTDLSGQALPCGVKEGQHGRKRWTWRGHPPLPQARTRTGLAATSNPRAWKPIPCHGSDMGAPGCNVTHLTHPGATRLPIDGISPIPEPGGCNIRIGCPPSRPRRIPPPSSVLRRGVWRSTSLGGPNRVSSPQLNGADSEWSHLAGQGRRGQERSRRTVGPMAADYHRHDYGHQHLSDCQTCHPGRDLMSAQECKM